LQERVEFVKGDQPLYYAKLLRDGSKENGPGRLLLYKSGELIGNWGCITGGNILDSRRYGGLTPPTKWVMVEEIIKRKHPTKGSHFSFGRIIPYGDKREYSKRTFGISGWPFMIHIRGSSSGCIAIDRSDWSDAVQKLNEAYCESTFIIEVIDEQS